MTKKKKQFLFDNLMYDTYGEVTPAGDTLRYAIAHTAKPGLLYKIEYLTKYGLPRTNSILYTKQESGELLPGKRTLISRTSDWGKTIDNTFYPEIMNTPVTEDYSKVGKIKQFLYNLSNKYLENGGQITNWLQHVPEEKCGGKVKKAENGLKTKPSNISEPMNFNITPQYYNNLSDKYKQILRNNKTNFGSVNAWIESSNDKLNPPLAMMGYTAAAEQSNAPLEKSILYKLGDANSKMISDKLYNEDLITAIEACGGKMKKKLMRQGGKIIEVPFEK